MLYEISRYGVAGDSESLRQQVSLVRWNGVLWRRTDGSETRCTTKDLTSAIMSDPLLNEVPANQVTRILAEPDVLGALPFALQVTGAGTDFDETLWSGAMVAEHLDDYAATDARGVYRVLYVNNDRWGAFTTTDGERLLPEGGESDDLPALDPQWGWLSFDETGGMSDGPEVCSIGLVTPGAAVTYAVSPYDGTELDLTRRGTDDAETLVDWLLDNPLFSRLSTCNAQLDVMMVRLFVGASIDGSESITGSELADGLDVDDDALGALDTSDWALSLDLDRQTTAAVLDRLAAKDPHYADEIAAARAQQSLRIRPANLDCSSFRPGHGVHWIQRKKAEEPQPGIDVAITVRSGGQVDIEGDGVSLSLWNHDPERVQAAWDHSGRSVWKPRWHILCLPNATGSSLFNMAGIEDHDPCQSQTDWPPTDGKI